MASVLLVVPLVLGSAAAAGAQSAGTTQTVDVTGTVDVPQDVPQNVDVNQTVDIAQSGAAASAGVHTGTLDDWVGEVDSALTEAVDALAAGRPTAARTVLLRAYLDYFEGIEGFYGPAGTYAGPGLSDRVAEAETRFHAILQGDATVDDLEQLRSDVAALPQLARAADVPLAPRAPTVVGRAEGPLPTASSPEITAILEELEAADAAYAEGRRAAAMERVESAYLEGFEPLEARLPSRLVSGVEKLFHLTVRPSIAAGAEPAVVSRGIHALGDRLVEADRALTGEASLWFGAANSFAIVVREGLEAVLLIGALLAYLGATGASPARRRQIYWGAAAGVGASLATWVVARTLVPITGAGRELVEGITGLAAVAVLMYVSNWLAQKTYIHDWKTYLREKMDQAVGAGSAFAMMSLAFAAVYREGFETVLFYQALLFDTGPGPVLAGFLVGAVLIGAIAVGIIRLGLRLPLRKVFAVTNGILVYLAFAFLGKSLYNLQEAGVFAPHPIAWAPDNGVLRQLFGLYPTAETLLAQAGFLALVGATYGLYRLKGARQRQARARTEEQAAVA